MTRQKWFRCVLCRKRMTEAEMWEVTAPEVGPEGDHDSFVACSSEHVALVMQAKVSA